MVFLPGCGLGRLAVDPDLPTAVAAEYLCTRETNLECLFSAGARAPSDTYHQNNLVAVVEYATMLDSESAASNTTSRAPVINANSDGAPFNSCPAEILSRTFELLRDDRERAGSLDWLTVSHVSRHWRAAALAHSQLWSSLNPLVLSRGLLDVFLDRSTPAPLVVLVSAMSGAKDHPLRQAYKQLLSAHIHRVQSLVYRDGEMAWQRIPAEEIALLLKGPAPMLRVLSLPGSKRSKLLFKEANVLSTFLSTRAPNVRRVELRQFPPEGFPWKAPPTSLRSLVLSADASAESLTTLTLGELLDGLRAMPQLQSLSLSGFATTRAQSNPVFELVYLPRLQTLRLTGDSDQHAVIWNSLRTHPLCTVRLEIVRSYTYPATLRSALVQHLAHTDVSALTEMVVNKTMATMVAFSLYPAGEPPIEDDTSEFTHPSITIFVAWEKPLEMAPYLPAVQIFLATPITTLRRLTLDALDLSRVDPEHMADLGPLARSLEVLTLRCFRSPMLSSAFLVLGGVIGSSRSMGGFPYPRLREIVLKRCEFDLDVAAPALRDALTRRALAGVKLERVKFVCCGLYTGRQEELENELVQTGLLESVVCEEDERLG